MAFLVTKFSPALLFQMEQSRQHGISLITKWLPKYKFKNWEKTETSEEKVTPSMRKKRAEEIAETLGDASRWHSHGRGIPMAELMGRDIKLLIEDFGKDPELSGKIRNYHGLASEYFGSTSEGYIHSKLGIRRVL